MKGNRIAVIVGVLVVAVALIVLVAKGVFPPRGDTAGTIGAANRYTAEQIGNQDVALKDPEVQAFLQSDTFHKLATNADFRQSVENMQFIEAFRHKKEAASLVSNAVDDLRKLKLSNNATAAVTDADLAKLSPPQIEGLLSVESLVLMEDLKFVAMLKTRVFQDGAAKGQVEEALKSRKEWGKYSAPLDELIKRHPDYLSAVADPAFQIWIDNANSRAFIAEYSKVASENLLHVLADRDARLIVGDRSFQALEGLAPFMDALKTPGMVTLLTSSVDWAALTKKYSE